MARIAICLPTELEEPLAREAVRHGHEIVALEGSGLALAGELLRARADCAIVGGGPRYLGVDLLEACDGAGVRLIVLAVDETERRRAISIGVADPLDASADWGPLEARLAGPDGPEDVSRPASGTVIAVWGPVGAPGRTSLAIGMAAELAATGTRVLLADADTHGAAVAPTLGLLDEAPGFAAACRLASTDSLNDAELDRIADTAGGDRGSFRVLTGLARADRWPELGHDRVTRVVERCRDWAQVTVIDVAAELESDEEVSSDLFAPHRNAATIAVLRAADHVVAVGSADPVGLSRLLRAYADLLETVTTRSVHVVANRLRTSTAGLVPGAQVRETLQRFGGITEVCLVPFDPPAFDAALLAGGTLVQHAPKSAARLAIRDFALRTFGEPGLRPRRRGRRRAFARLP